MATAKQLRALISVLPEAEERSHFGKPDFRVRGKIFAGLSRDELIGVVKLSHEEQRERLDANPEIFFPASGAWGRNGWTHFHLALLSTKELGVLLASAHRLVSPRSVAPRAKAKVRAKKKTTRSHD